MKNTKKKQENSMKMEFDDGSFFKLFKKKVKIKITFFRKRKKQNI
jgi:hypothetical protein